MHDRIRARWRPEHGWRALRVSAFVGTVLVGIHQGEVLLASGIMALPPAKVALSYAVPFCVSLYSSMTSGGSRDDG